MARIRSLRSSLAGVAAVGSVACVSGCGGSGGAGIDVPALDHELATVIRLEKLSTGYELDVKAACTPAGGPLNFSCRIDATSPDTPVVNSWTVLVECRPPADADVPRCTSDTGYALQ